MNQGEYIAKLKITADTSSAVAGIQSVQDQMSKLTSTKVFPGFEKTGISGTAIKQQMDGVAEATTKGKTAFEELGLAMKRAILVAPVWMLMRGAIQAVSQTIGDQLKFLMELETAMARIKVVGKGTAEEYNYLQGALVNLGHAYGASSSEAAQAAVLFAQQGKTVKETIELTRVAMLSSVILGTDMKTSVDDMTAALEGFKLGVGDATSVVDKWINVEKAFAVTSKDLADATKVAGASANQLGITMSEFLGDVTAVVEVTRKSGAEVARGLSFIYARLNTTAKETIQQLTKVPYYLDEQGNATSQLTTKMRGTSDILGEVASKWDSLDKKERLQIATALGSMRQMTVLNALMQNYNTSLDARISALTSAGAAEKAFAILQDTTAHKLKQLGTSWNVLTNAVANTTAFKGAVDYLDDYLIRITSLFNYKKAYEAAYIKEIKTEQLAAETRVSEIKSLEEIVRIREKLSRAPKTEANLERSKVVEDYLANISKKEPRIKVALELGTPEALRQITEDIQKEADKRLIQINVGAKYAGEFAELQSKIKATTLGPGEFNKDAKILNAKYIKEEADLYKKVNDEVEDQYKTQKTQEKIQKLRLEDIDEENKLSNDLTDKEQEQLDIEKELLRIRLQGTGSLEEQVQKEIQLVEQNKYSWLGHEKTLKLSELQNKLLDARLQKQAKEVSNLTEMSIKYEQANGQEKGRIRRAAELQLMDPERAAQAYQSSMFDKGIIEEYWSSFSAEAQKAIGETTTLFRDLQGKLPTVDLNSIYSVQNGVTTYTPEMAAAAAAAGNKNAMGVIPSIANTANFGNVVINMPVESLLALTEEVVKEFQNKIMTSDDFQKWIGMIANARVPKTR
jgi:TP901 family phage tail tape measure protein